MAGVQKKHGIGIQVFVDMERTEDNTDYYKNILDQEKYLLVNIPVNPEGVGTLNGNLDKKEMISIVNYHQLPLDYG